MRKNERTLLISAFADLRVAKDVVDKLSEDEIELNTAAYLLQHALEKTMKHVLMYAGIQYIPVRDLSVLYRNFEQCFQDMSEDLRERLDVITIWEEKERYLVDYLVDMYTVKRIIPMIEDYMNTVSDKSRITTTHLFD